jgi:hypothetical protein
LRAEPVDQQPGFSSTEQATPGGAHNSSDRDPIEFRDPGIVNMRHRGPSVG